MLKYVDKPLEIITKEQLAERNKLMMELNEKGTLAAYKARKLHDIEKKIRLCNMCGKNYQEAEGWAIATLENGEAIGLFQNCFKCDMQRIADKAQKEGWNKDLIK